MDGRTGCPTPPSCGLPTTRALLAESVADDVGSVGAYIAPVEIGEDGIRPGNLREKIRQQGVTIDLLVSA